MHLQVPRFDNARVLVAGDVMLDRYWSGEALRISPEAPVPVVTVNHSEERPGGAANVALNIAALGAAAALVGVTGADEAADSLAARLAAVGIACHFTRIPGQQTITKLRVLSRHQQLMRLDFETPVLAAQSRGLCDAVGRLLPGMDVLVLSDYAKGTLAEAPRLIREARLAGKAVMVDPKGTDFGRYAGATLLTPNLREFEAVAGSCASERELADRARALASQHGLDALLVTRGEQGMTLVPRDAPVLHLPARAREVFDVTGAGDTVIGVLAAAFASGSGLAEAAALANLAAGIVVGKLGTAVLGAPELRFAVQREQGSERGVLALEQLLDALAGARARGERIVMTNGCFDIVHAGHVGYLDQARSLGDRLVVAVNSDASVARLKGAGRPVNPLERRMAVLAALESVDWVLAFDEDTPETLLRSLRPDILVKGGDYARDEVVGREIVEAYGGEVRVLDLIQDCSTSAIVARIRQR